MVPKRLLELLEPQQSGSPKTMDSETKLQDIEANLMSSTWRVSGELNISQSNMAFTFMTFVKPMAATELCLRLIKYYKTYDSPEDISRFILFLKDERIEYRTS